MKKKIAVMGLYSIPNMGDLILCEASQFLVREYGKKTGTEFEIVPVDLYPRYPSDYHGADFIKYCISVAMKLRAKKKFKYEDGSKNRYDYESKMWTVRLKNKYIKALKDMDAVIFAGGGFLKFRTQGLNYYVEMVIEIAKEYNIPVMMNGVGIEGYDENDVRCRRLKDAINSSVVKVITTRDDIDILRNNYIVNPDIKISRVGDPALWTPECYGVKRDEERSIFGINVIRGNVFKDYGNDSSYDDLVIFYKELVRELEARKLPWVFFSNGMESDQAFGRRVLSDLNISAEEKLLPAPATSMQLLDMIKTFKCVFGARLHACITSYAIDVPVVGFIWNEKTRMFAEIIGKRDSFFEEGDLNVSEIVDRMEDAAEEEYDGAIRDESKQLTAGYLEDFLSSI